jgi:formate-dependent nitrite reductase membrane component NrfD
MATVQPVIVGDSFAVGYRFQKYWDDSMATAFFFGELGAGLFFISFFYDVMLGMILGLAITGILKTYFHTAHMGVPAKSWRAILRPDRAWVSRGLITIIFFTTFGVLHLLTEFNGVFGLVPGDGTLATVIRTIAGASALGVMAYHGLAMSDSTAISLWSNRLMPFASIAYALIAGAALTAVLGWGASASGVAENLPSLTTLSLYLLIANIVIVAGLLFGALNGAPGARVSAGLLLKGPFSNRFVPLVLGVGLALPLLLLLFAPEAYWAALLEAAAIIVGYYFFRVFVFRAGVYDPIISFAPKTQTG